jgi:hypothetical protein
MMLDNAAPRSQTSELYLYIKEVDAINKNKNTSRIEAYSQSLVVTKGSTTLCGELLINESDS